MSTWIVCRLCLEEDERYLTKFQLTDHLIDIIFTLTSVHILTHSEETIHLCSECEHLIIRFHDFRESCIENDTTFRQRIDEEAQPQDDGFDIALKDEDGENSDGASQNQCQIEYLLSEEDDETVMNEQETNKEQGKRGDEFDVLNKTATHSAKQMLKRSRSAKDRTRKSGDTRNKPNRKTPNKAERSVPCVQCGKMIIRHNMKLHMLTHTGGAPIKCCSYCGKPYRNMHLLKVHINSHHTFEQKFECDDCGKVYYRSQSLREHVLTNHTTEKRFECGVCGMKFVNFNRKQYHYISAHTVAKPFGCQYCDRKFKFRGDLTVHIRTHTGEKPFACDICGKRFSKSYNVVIHKKSHAHRSLRIEAVSEIRNPAAQ